MIATQEKQTITVNDAAASHSNNKRAAQMNTTQSPADRLQLSTSSLKRRLSLTGGTFSRLCMLLNSHSPTAGIRHYVWKIIYDYLITVAPLSFAIFDLYDSSFITSQSNLSSRYGDQITVRA
jgi:hypothetical protein